MRKLQEGKDSNKPSGVCVCVCRILVALDTVGAKQRILSLRILPYSLNQLTREDETDSKIEKIKRRRSACARARGEAVNNATRPLK